MTAELMPKSMLNQVLNQVQHQHGVTPLFSRVVGSHLWGYADGISDYDVQFVFVRRLNDYLGFLPHKTIRFETSLFVTGEVGHVDAFGYEITDFMRLLSKNDMNVTQFLSSPSNGWDAPCISEVQALAERTRQPNLLIRKYVGHARSSAAALAKGSGLQRTESWNAVRALIFAHQMQTVGYLKHTNLFEASKLYTPSLNLELGPSRMPIYSREAFNDLLVHFGNVDLSYPERTDEEVEEFNTMAKAIVRRFADTVWS